MTIQKHDVYCASNDCVLVIDRWLHESILPCRPFVEFSCTHLTGDSQFQSSCNLNSKPDTVIYLNIYETIIFDSKYKKSTFWFGFEFNFFLRLTTILKTSNLHALYEFIYETFPKKRETLFANLPETVYLLQKYSQNFQNWQQLSVM